MGLPKYTSCGKAIVVAVGRACCIKTVNAYLVLCARLYSSFKSGNGTKISDKKWRSAKTKYLKNKKDKRVLQKALESWMLSDCNEVSCFQQISKKNRIYLWSLGIFTFPWFLTPWQHLHWWIFVSVESNRTIILSIDRSEPRFQCHTEGKIRMTLRNTKNFDVLC